MPESFVVQRETQIAAPRASVFAFARSAVSSERTFAQAIHPVMRSRMTVTAEKTFRFTASSLLHLHV